MDKCAGLREEVADGSTRVSACLIYSQFSYMLLSYPFFYPEDSNGYKGMPFTTKFLT